MMRTSRVLRKVGFESLPTDYINTLRFTRHLTDAGSGNGYTEWWYPFSSIEKIFIPRSVEVAPKNLDLVGWVRILAGK